MSVLNTAERLRVPLWGAKSRAAGIHLLISGSIFIALLVLILGIWYPPPYFQISGGWQGIRLVFAVDVVLGPALTFIVFNPLKPRREMVRDLSLVGFVQTFALAWGISVVHAQRPVVVAEVDGVFYSHSAEIYDVQGADLKTIRGMSDLSPPVVHVRNPASQDELKAMMLLAMNHQIPQSGDAGLYQKLNHAWDAISKRAVDIAGELRADPGLESDIAAVEKASGKMRHDLVFMRLKGTYGDALLVFSRTGRMIDYIVR